MLSSLTSFLSNDDNLEFEQFIGNSATTSAQSLQTNDTLFEQVN